jgi:iron(III) transport system substrate-binding protein
MNTSQLPLFILLALFLITLVLPFTLRPAEGPTLAGGLPLVIVSPHNEAIRYEFATAFSEWHEARFGDPVNVDWRNVGGTSEIARYISSQYSAAFRAYWAELGREWNAEVASAFNDPKIDPADVSIPAAARQARQAFLDSDVSIGIDLFFGGGQYDHSKQAAMGHTVPCGYRDLPEAKEVLGKEIPEIISGERWYDSEDHWYGVTVSSFGICYNTDVINRLSGVVEPEQWRDLGQPGLFGQVALADPTKSGSIAKAFEMVIQQEMATAVEGLAPGSDEYVVALKEGWANGLNVVRRAAANSRYFTDSSSKVPFDVAMGDAAVGMCIDFYGLFQAENVARSDGTSRMRYLSPQGGTTVSCDPIAMLRGAPHRELALRFIRFTLSPEGQKLWGFRPGTPGGPKKYALHRPPIRRDFYTPENEPYRSDPGINPYLLTESFTSHSEWTGRYFNAIRLLVRTMCLDAGEELRTAWKTILDDGGPEACPEAMEVFNAIPESAEYDQLSETFAAMKGKIDEVRQARMWGNFFASQYREAQKLAEGREEDPS